MRLADHIANLDYWSAYESSCDEDGTEATDEGFEEWCEAGAELDPRIGEDEYR